MLPRLVFDVPGRDDARQAAPHQRGRRLDPQFLCFEPRGRPQTSANLVFPSLDPQADAGFIICQADRAHAMSGSNTICVVTALLETGTIPMVEPETHRRAGDGGGTRSASRRPVATVVASG